MFKKDKPQAGYALIDTETLVRLAKAEERAECLQAEVERQDEQLKYLRENETELRAHMAKKTAEWEGKIKL